MKFFEPITLSKLLTALNAVPYEIIGDSNISVSGLDDYRVVLPGELTWVDYAPLYHEVFPTPAAVILLDSVPESIPQDKVLIVTKDPKSAFDKIAEAFYPSQFAPRSLWQRLTNPRNVHKGKNCHIHPTASIGRDVHIGDNVTIEAHVTIYDNVHIGNDTVIRAGTVIGIQPFAYIKQRDGHWEQRKAWGNTIILDHVDISALNTIERGITGSTIIGSGTKTCSQVHIGHDTWIGSNCFLSGNVGISGYVRIKNDCTFWSRSGVANSVNIPEGTTVQSSCSVHQSVKQPGKTLAGVPAIDAEKYWRDRAVMNIIVNDYISSKE